MWLVWGHHRDRGINESQNKVYESNDNDSEYIFYCDIMDGIHCFVYHLYDLGLRIDAKEANGDFKKTKDLIDEKISFVKEIKDLRQNRYESNNELSMNQIMKIKKFLTRPSGVLECQPE